MEKATLLDLFQKLGYNWNNDLEKISYICKHTKTRKNPNLSKFVMPYGSEQTFLIKAVLDSVGCKKYFEIGTGRGTSAYAASLSPTVNEIITLDKIPFSKKRSMAINYKEKTLSMKDLNELIEVETKQKIEFLHSSKKFVLAITNFSKFNVVFIDGNHDNRLIIYLDFLISWMLIKKNGVIIFDDYELNRFKVKAVVDTLRKLFKSYNFFLIHTRGFLFEKSNIDNKNGMVLMCRNKLM